MKKEKVNNVEALNGILDYQASLLEEIANKIANEPGSILDIDSQKEYPITLRRCAKLLLMFKIK